MKAKELWALFLLWWGKNGDLKGDNKAIEWNAYRAGFQKATEIAEKKTAATIKEIQEALEP